MSAVKRKPEDTLLTPEEVRVRLRLKNVKSVYRWLDEGKLKGVKILGHLWRIPESALAEIMENNDK